MKGGICNKSSADLQLFLFFSAEQIFKASFNYLFSSLATTSLFWFPLTALTGKLWAVVDKQAAVFREKSLDKHWRQTIQQTDTAREEHLVAKEPNISLRSC